MSLEDGRRLISASIAEQYGYRVEEVHTVYERLLKHREAKGQKVFFGTHMADVKRALLFAKENGISPMEAAINLFELPEEKHDGTKTT